MGSLEAETAARTSASNTREATCGTSFLLMAAKVHQLAEFQPLLTRLDACGVSYALIGGLAVAHYGEHYLTPEQKTAHQFPIYSKDIDFRGGNDLFQAIQQEAGAAGMELAGGLGVIKPKPGFNRVPGYVLAVSLAGETTSIEILERLPLHNLEMTELDVTGSVLTISGVAVLDPCTLLLAKLAAFHERPQGETNHDAAHCAILRDVIPAFLKDAADRHRTGETDYDPAEDAWRLRRVLERNQHPLPGDETANRLFIQHLNNWTHDWLVETRRISP